MNLASHFNETTRIRAVKYLLSRHLVRTIEDSEDAVQDAFVSAWKHRASFRGHSAFGTWFIRIAIHAALMRRRTNGSKVSAHSVVSKEFESGDEATYLEAIAVPAVEYNPFLRKRLLNAMHELTPIERQAILHVYGREWTNQKAANQLHVKFGTMKCRVHRARKKLRKLLDAA